MGETRRGKRGAGRRDPKPRGGEWVGGLVTLPGYVTGEGEPYRLEALLWIDAQRAILGSTVGRPGELLQQAGEGLRAAIEKPAIGRPHVPARVRVGSPDLAMVLRATHPSIEIVCAPTPELDELLAAISEDLDEIPTSYLGPGIDADAIASFFRAAAGLFRAAPWTVLPEHVDAIAVTIEALELHDAALAIVGQLGENRGLMFFAGLDELDDFVDAVEAIERGEDPEMPPHFGFHFERGADLPPELLEEIAAHGWTVAAPEAYPWLAFADEDTVARPATPAEVTIAEAVALALPAVLADPAIAQSRVGDDPIERTVSVRTHAGEVTVTLRVPYAAAEPRPPLEVLDDLRDLADDEEIDDVGREALEDELLASFADSAEAIAIEDVGACRLVMDLAAEHFGATIATLESDDLREIVFEAVPHAVTMAPAEARAFIEETRAFYRFMRREARLAQAGACLSVLGGTAVEKLEAALGEGTATGIERVQANALAQDEAPAPAPASRGGGAAAQKKRKQKQKDARKARKKNR